MAPPDDITIESLLSPEGWAYASLPPVEEGDPGRFNALFGRDSLIFALQVLPHHPQVARDTLRAHAALQARVDDPEIDAEPGKIIHEYWPVAPQRLIEAGWPIRDGGMRYYGTADATSWFLLLLAATGQRALADELSDAWQSAAGWLTTALDRGDGFVRYQRSPGYSGGLSQQGWRDALSPSRHSHGGGILRPDGTEPAPPLADADCQAAAVAALRSLAVLEPGRAGHWNQLAAGLVARISAAFTPDVMAIEPDGSIVPGAGSQLGWLLWAGALDEPAEQAAAQRLTQPDLLTGFGLRTLSSDHRAFAPDAYHRGAIWPFDSWLGWGGLRAAGRSDEAQQVRDGVLAALDGLGRAPELYAVSTAGALEPVAAANRVQAWTVGAARALRAGWDGRTAAMTG